MNEIIKNIEAAQLKESVADFKVGDTVKVYAKIKEGNRERIQVSKEQLLRDRVEALVKHLQLENSLMVLVLRRLGHYTHQTLIKSKLFV